MKRLAAIFLFCCLTACISTGKEAALTDWDVNSALPVWETKILRDVGAEYELTPAQFKLLLTIRRIENGGPGIEMGVASNFPKHRARRYSQSPQRSLRVQARWAAGTIKNHYTGDLNAFAKVYCPPQWRHWARMGHNRDVRLSN